MVAVARCTRWLGSPAARCRAPPGTVYAGPPYLAFVAGVGIAGSQPDRFIIQASPVLADFRAAADGDGPVCP
jgi:hypothetical protein